MGQQFYREVRKKGSFVVGYKEAELTKKEVAVKDRLEEIGNQLRKLHKEQSRLLEGCKHPAFYDVPGFPYDSRRCAICDAFMYQV